jgi:hypothetical protein
MSTDFLTVATVDYTPQALATLRSARRHGSHASYNYFALDATPESLLQLRDILGDDAAWINLFGPYDLRYERDRFLASFAYYNPFELACFSKYLAAAHVMQSPGAADVCVYADSDILFFGNIAQACAAIGDNAALVTTHQLGPAPDADEMEHLQLGWLNAGFFCLRRAHPDMSRILDWLIERISRRGFSAPQHGQFVDQVWLSSMVFTFPGTVAFSTHPGMNVAYWNLDERPLRKTGGDFSVGDEPLLFFHFSGFVPYNREKLSKHAGNAVEPGSALDAVCEAYRDALQIASASSGASKTLARIACNRAHLKARLAAGIARHGEKAAIAGNTGLAGRAWRKIRAVFA